MADQNFNKSRITITDVADALGISKTTVSRAISGKGRIGEETKKRVLDYIEETNYHPNSIAKGLAQSKTYNVGWVIPGESSFTDLPFFQRCMVGISEIATALDYDILISMVYGGDLDHLKRVITNHKVDGVILGRTLVNDNCVKYLQKTGIPFVVIGSTDEDNVIQVDNDHVNACKEIVSILILKGIKRIALIGGDETHVVNRTRQQGFEAAVREQHLSKDDVFIYQGAENKASIERFVEDALRNNVQCIIGMDDRICMEILAKLRKDKVQIPRDVKVASFYSSDLLESNVPPITSLTYDPKELGMAACKTLFNIIEGEEVEERVLLGYEVAMRGSTQ